MNNKILTVITVIVLSLTLAVSWAFTAAAANRKGNGACTGVNCVTGQNYVDSDGDGICDNAKNPQRPQDGTGRQNGFCRGANR